MGSNWAAEFRQRMGESEGKTPTYDVGGALEEEETEVEEPESELEEETEEVGEPEKAEAEEPLPKPAVDVGEKAAELFRSMTGQVAPPKPKPQPQPEPQPKPSSGNPAGAVMAAIMGLLVLQSLPTIFNTMTSAFQPMTASGSSSPQGYPVQCSYCGWTGIGVAGMRCPRCGRS